MEVGGLWAGYGGPRVCEGIDLTVNPGEAVALLGRNGAGKTTTLMALAGDVPERGGSFRLSGQELMGLPSHLVARAGVSLVPQGRRVFAGLTVRENLLVAGSPADAQRMLRLFPSLEARADRLGLNLSGGEQQMLAIARALMTRPQLLLMDEPSEGLAPIVVREVGRLARHLAREEGLAVLLAEQNLRLALDTCDRVYILERGRVAHAGSAADLSARPDLQHRFLGV